MIINALRAQGVVAPAQAQGSTSFPSALVSSLLSYTTKGYVYKVECSGDQCAALHCVLRVACCVLRVVCCVLRAACLV